ncbi:glucuronate isomerase [Treponema primitia]
MGSFQGDSIPDKIQLYSAWWFPDHRVENSNGRS